MLGYVVLLKVQYSCHTCHTAYNTWRSVHIGCGDTTWHRIRSVWMNLKSIREKTLETENRKTQLSVGSRTGSKTRISSVIAEISHVSCCSTLQCQDMLCSWHSIAGVHDFILVVCLYARLRHISNLIIWEMCQFEDALKTSCERLQN